MEKRYFYSSCSLFCLKAQIESFDQTDKKTPQSFICLFFKMRLSKGGSSEFVNERVAAEGSKA